MHLFTGMAMDASWSSFFLLKLHSNTKPDRVWIFCIKNQPDKILGI